MDDRFSAKIVRCLLNGPLGSGDCLPTARPLEPWALGCAWATLGDKQLRDLHSPTRHQPNYYHNHSDNQNNVNQASGDME